MSEWLDALQPNTFSWSQDMPARTGPRSGRSSTARSPSPDHERRAFRVAPCAYWRSDCGGSSATVLQRVRDAATIEECQRSRRGTSASSLPWRRRRRSWRRVLRRVPGTAAATAGAARPSVVKLDHVMVGHNL